MGYFSRLLEKDVFNRIPSDDILARQRYFLFRIYTLTGILIFLIFSFEEYTFNQLNGYRIFIFAASAATLIINYAGLQFHRDYKLAYSISIIAGFILIHCATYYSGGVRNPDFLYFGSIILYAYIVLENKGGKITLYAAILNIVYFYILTDFTEPGSIISSTKSTTDLDLRHLITALTSMFLITALSSYLEHAKNAVINKIEDSNAILKKKNDDLRELSLVASGTENSVIMTDSHGTIEWVNEGFTRLTGYTFEEAQGKKQHNFLFGPDSSEQSVSEMETLQFTGSNMSLEILKYRKDGSEIWVNEKITRIKDENDGKTRYVFMESNITERKESETRITEYLTNLERTNQELDKFAYVVSHDLKAPLRAIGNLTGWIEEDAGHMLPGEVRNNFNIIKQRVVRMEALINGILAYSKAAKNTNPYELIDTSRLIRETMDLCGINSNTSFEIQDNLPSVYSDKFKLQQVFLNLFSNAVRFNQSETKCVKISCLEEKDHFTFTVNDNGPGIDPRFHEKIFIIFQTIERRDDFESTGVGLAIVKKIVEELGGRIWVESEPNKGASFIFTVAKTNPEEVQDVTYQQTEGNIAAL